VIKLVIFDMDGVLVDACDWHRIAFNLALKNVCNYELSLEEHYKEYNGLPTKIKLKKLKDKGMVTENLFDTIESLKQENTIKLINDLCAYDSSKVELLKYLKDKNIKIACYTNSIRKTAELILKKAGVLSSLDKLITNQDVNSPKPNPEGYINCINFFNVSPNETIIVEDSPKGIEAASGAGAFIIKVDNAKQVNIDLMKEYI